MGGKGQGGLCELGQEQFREQKHCSRTTNAGKLTDIAKRSESVRVQLYIMEVPSPDDHSWPAGLWKRKGQSGSSRRSE